MFTNRLFVLIAAFALLTVAALTFEVSTTRSAAVPSTGDLTDYALRHRGSIASGNPVGAFDWFERHPEMVSPVIAADRTDYYQRHREGLNINDAANATDWYMRHPGYIISVPAADLSDYFQRHRSANAADLIDWYQRHRSAN